MNENNDLDSWLAGLECDDMSTDDVFVQAVMARVERHQHRRRLTLGMACGLACAIIGVLLIALPAPGVAPATTDAFNILAALILVASCGTAWLVTEDTATRK